MPAPLSMFEKNCSSIKEGLNEEQKSKFKLSDVFKDYLNKYVVATDSITKLKMHPNSISNRTVKEMLSYFIEKNDIKNIEIVIQNYHTPNSDDIFSEDFKFRFNNILIKN